MNSNSCETDKYILKLAEMEVERKLHATQKERNRMHRRAQLAEAKYSKLCRLLETEGARLLKGPVVVKKSSDAHRLLNTIWYESFFVGQNLGRKEGLVSPIVSALRWFARKVSNLAYRLKDLNK